MNRSLREGSLRQSSYVATRGSIRVESAAKSRRGTHVNFAFPGTAFESALVRVSLIGSNMFLPLCSKPSMLRLTKDHPDLIECYIAQCLNAGQSEAQDTKLVIFIADGDVMAQADIAMGKSVPKANSQVKEISDELRKMVDAAVEKLCDEDEENRSRISGIIHWNDIEQDKQFQILYKKMEEIMNLDFTSPPPEMEDDLITCCKEIQIHMKTLVKELFIQRIEKASRGGHTITNVFDGDTLELIPGNKYKKRFDALLKSSLLEVSNILVGCEHNGTRFTEMQYMNNDAAGMTKIAMCLLKIRATLSITPMSPFILDLKMFAAYNFGIELLNIVEEPENSDLAFPTISAVE